MAESVLIGMSCKILSCVASPAFKKAYEKGVSIWEARDELAKLQVTIETLQAVLIDAEKKQESSDAIKNWIQRLKSVLYDAEDLFDEFATEDLLKQRMKEGKSKLSLKNQVRVCCSKLNPIVSRNSVAKKVKAIRETLVDISNDMAHFGFVQYHPNESMYNIKREKHSTWSSRGAKAVFGRDEDVKVILDMLISESSDTCISDVPIVIAIDGIGGIGKTTLAHMIYRDEKVEMMFEKRWFACISNTSNEIEVLGKIYQSICGGSYNDLSVIHLEEKIRESIVGKKYLLVLDDVWEDHHGRWENRKSLLSSGANGSRIVVTTRLPSVVVAIGAVRSHNLGVLSENDAWDLFKSLAFLPSYEKDPRRESLGRELLKRCRGLPLSVWCMGSLLHNKTIQEWEDLERGGLPTLQGKYNDETMSILKLSYDHLPSNLKQCFTYCSLFPKDHIYAMKELTCHWIAQGYSKPGENESDFMHLLRMGFFQEVEEDDEFGEIYSKMHDILHDLALYLVGEESIMLSGTSLNASSCTRHVSLIVDEEESGLWKIPTSLLNVKSLRSFLMAGSLYHHMQPNLDHLCSNFKVLRTLALSSLEIEHIPTSIGELKLLRYLDLSGNLFVELPDSITNLVNLLTLNLFCCMNLKAWPRDFKKLIKLRYLNNLATCELMPEEMEVMRCLQYLNVFNIGKRSDLEVLNGLLKQLRGCLLIGFREEMEGELRWELPSDVSLRQLDVYEYPGERILGWGNNKSTSKLECLHLISWWNVKYLPSMSCFSILKRLKLEHCSELEFIEDEEEEVNAYNNATSNKLFFPCLEELELRHLEKLKGWWGKVAAESSTSSSSSFLEFSHLSKLRIEVCTNLELKSFPLCPNLLELRIEDVGNDTSSVQEFPPTILCSSSCSSLEKIVIAKCNWLLGIPGETLACLRELAVKECCSLKSLILASPHLLKIEIEECNELMSIQLSGSRPSLRLLRIKNCQHIQSLHVDKHVATSVKVIDIKNCPELRLSKAAQDKRLILVQHDFNSIMTEPLLSSLPMPSLYNISIFGCKGPINLPEIALASLRQCLIENTDGLESLHIPSAHLQGVILKNCVGLTSVEVDAPTHIEILLCPELKNLRIAHPNAIKKFKIVCPSSASADWDSIPNLGGCVSIWNMKLGGVDVSFIERLLSSPSLQLENSSLKSIGFVSVALTSLQHISIKDVHGLQVLRFKSQHLICIKISNCEGLTSVELDSPLTAGSVASRVIVRRCSRLKNVHIARPISLERLIIIECPELSLSTGVDWDSLTNFNSLELHPLPPLEEVKLHLPQCLVQRHALGNLRIVDAPRSWW